VSSSEICLVHLVWAPEGPGSFRAFLAAHAAHPPGTPHRLAILCNGFDGERDERLAAVRSALEGVEHHLLIAERPLLDLAAYRWAAERIDARRVCFTNSYSRPLIAGWLARLDAALADGGPAVAGASGSCESALSAAPFWLRPLRRRDFGPFPNPHLRSNTFLLDRELMLSLRWEVGSSKTSAWALESGKRSISRQIWERGGDVLVVGRDGAAHPPERWRESATFRSGGQRNLLVSDNRTEQYADAPPELKAMLERMAWGSAEAELSPVARRPASR
jgi:hypothetical protein